MNMLGAQIMAMGPVGVPLENFSEAHPNDSYWYDEVVRKISKYRYVRVDGAPWTVERIGRHVYTFAVDHEDFARKKLNP